VVDEWTLEQLVELVGKALAADGVRAPNGRIRDVPDARVLRWYATIGLLDRPSAFRGRTALYGHRHLLQAVAVKRRQAEGMALAQIQAELSGASDAALRRVARIPAGLLDTSSPLGTSKPAGPGEDLVEVRSPRASFWRTPTVAPAPQADAATSAAHSVTRAAGSAARAGAESRHLIRLGPGAVLVLTAAPSAADVADLGAAAAPLIRLLADRGLLTAEEPRDDDH
jgi:DNA-binding transcriptional MerR regulator